MSTYEQPLRFDHSLVAFEDTADVTLSFLELSDDAGTDIRPSHKVHKLVLAASSPMFCSMFFDASKPQSNVQILDAKPSTFGKLIAFLYGNPLEFTSTAEACEVLKTADKYRMSVPALVAEDYLCRTVEVANCIEIFEQVSGCLVTRIKEKCIEIFQGNTKEILDSPEFLKASVDTVNAICSTDIITGAKEFEVYSALAKWLKTKERSTRVLNCIALKKSLKFIRFLQFKPSKICCFNLLSHGERIAIIHNILSPSDAVPMPTGFSTSRTDRWIKKKEICSACGCCHMDDYDY